MFFFFFSFQKRANVILLKRAKKNLPCQHKHEPSFLCLLLLFQVVPLEKNKVSKLDESQINQQFKKNHTRYREIPTATFVNPGKSIKVKLTTVRTKQKT